MCQGVFQNTSIGDQCFLKELKFKLSTKNKQTKIFALWTPIRGEAILIIPPDLLSLAIFHLLDCCQFLDNSHEDQFGRLKVEIIKPLHSLQSWFKKIRMQRQDKVTRRHQSPSPVPRCFFPFSVQVHAFKVPSFCIQYIK